MGGTGIIRIIHFFSKKKKAKRMKRHDAPINIFRRNTIGHACLKWTLLEPELNSIEIKHRFVLFLSYILNFKTVQF